MYQLRATIGSRRWPGARYSSTSCSGNCANSPEKIATYPPRDIARFCRKGATSRVCSGQLVQFWLAAGARVVDEGTDPDPGMVPPPAGIGHGLADPTTSMYCRPDISTAKCSGNTNLVKRCLLSPNVHHVKSPTVSLHHRIHPYHQLG